MTLYRQLLIFTFFMFLVLFVGVYLAKLNNTRTFLENQLESHAMDTATSLGLSITPYMADRDIPVIETMINAIFDHGYYRIIRLTDLRGEVLVERSLDVVVQDVPAWFIRGIKLRLPLAETLITSGWNQVGNLEVESHPGYAYRSLWNMAVSMAYIFLAMGVLVAVLGSLGLSLLLRPLRRVESQAEALCNRQYTFQERLPKTRELRRVVVAMNSMTGKVKQMFDDQVQTADQFRKNAYTDALTGLGNRRFLESEIQAEMQLEKGVPNGAFLLVEVHNLANLNRENGFEFGDSLLISVARILKHVASRYEQSIVTRLSGGGFALLFPDITAEEAGLAAAAIAGGLGDLARAEPGLDGNVGSVGGVSYYQSSALGVLLSAADRVLRTAQRSGDNSWKLESLNSRSAVLPQGEMAWRKILETALAEKKILLFGQRVAAKDKPGETAFFEIFSRIPAADGQLYNAGIFIPLAERLNCVAAIDRLVVESLILFFQTGTLPSENVAVNMSVSSLRDSQFMAWLMSQLRDRKKNLPHFVFEFTEFGVAKELPLILEFAENVRALGCEVGVDHFGKGFVNFGYLQSLRPCYVKIDRAFTVETGEESSDSQFFISALTGVARSLDILVIADGVENETQYKRLAAMNVDGFQGYFIDSPEQI